MLLRNSAFTRRRPVRSRYRVQFFLLGAGAGGVPTLTERPERRSRRPVISRRDWSEDSFYAQIGGRFGWQTGKHLLILSPSANALLNLLEVGPEPVIRQKMAKRKVGKRSDLYEARGVFIGMKLVITMRRL